jgi:hypothetical protein
VALFAIAIILVVSGLAFGVAFHGTGNLLPTGTVAGEVILGAIAVAFSLPLIGMTFLFATRRNLQVEWRQADHETRMVVIAYVAIEAGGAVVLWGIFLLVALHG